MKWYRRPGACALLPVIGFLFAVATMSGQTRLDLRSQAKNVDFSNALSARPFPVGTSLPATCNVGETWFKPDAPAGQNLYMCVATNIWTGIQFDFNKEPYDTVRSLGAGPYLNVTCTSGAESTTGQCTMGLDISNLAVPDSNNVLSGITSFPATPPQSITAQSTIVCDATRVAVTAGAPLTLTATPAIADPVRDGQVCIVQNTGSNDITLTSGVNQNLKLAAATVVLKAGQPLMLIWDQATSLWTQQMYESAVTSVASKTGAVRLVTSDVKADFARNNVTPSCPLSETQLTTLTIPSLGVGGMARVTMLIGKSSAGTHTWRVRHTSTSGPVVAYLSTSDINGRIALELHQQSSTEVVSVGTPVKENSAVSPAIFAPSSTSGFIVNNPLLSQSADASMTLAISGSGCAGSENMYIRNAVVEVVRAQ